MIPGHATAAATAAHAARFAARLGPSAFTPLGATGLVTSRLGFGGYRIDDETPEHREALEAALDAGVNLIDTSTNYTDGGSERLVGRVLADLTRAGRLGREAVVVVSKIGYVQGQNLALAREREAAGRPFPEMVKYMEQCWHAIHPEFLADQLPRSRERLGLATLDVCLLHNPEYFFSDAAQRGSGPLPALRAEFDRRLRAAFGFFEAEVAAGRLCWYGVSSNTVTRPVADPEATSLARMLAAAGAAGGPGHHFRVLQCPMNLFEAGALLERNNPPDAPAAPVLAAAARAGLGVLLNRPLNAVVQDRLVRLADVPGDGVGVDLDAQLERVRALEAEYRREIAAAIGVGPDATPPDEFFSWADRLGGLLKRPPSLEHWGQIERRMVTPVVEQVVRALDAGLAEPLAARWRAWRDRYRPELVTLLAAFRHRATAGARSASHAVATAIDPALPAARRAAPLSRKALWTLASTPGVSSVLVGMRRPEYVADALGILAWPPLAPVEPVYAAAQASLLGGG
jgi:aryl-alcohol dehydrogenase-like predicted oxidoreductase